MTIILSWAATTTGQPVLPKQREVTEGLRAPRGTVTALSKEGITLQIPGKADMQFVPSETLAAGKTPSKTRPRAVGKYSIGVSYKYRLSDVHVGDSVDIIYAVVNGVDVCDHICIIKRPGGLVPPLPDDADEQGTIRYHEARNAYWNLEDNGIPYPAHFAYRRFPIAPPPREVKRDAPPAAGVKKP